MRVDELKQALCSALFPHSGILGMAQTGDIHAPLIPGNSDVDLFVLCKTVPDQAERAKRYAGLAGLHDGVQMEVCNCETWGAGDVFTVDGIDVMPMYFACDAFYGYVNEVLAGKHLFREGRFYPIGRLATVETIHILFEKENVWTGIIKSVQAHPKALFQSWYAAQSALILDEEDLGRAALRRDVFFYHQVLEEALDHFLQALYAMNDAYFPSRKRNAADIARFARKPENCIARLQFILESAVQPDTVEASIRALRTLAEELKTLGIGQ